MPGTVIKLLKMFADPEVCIDDIAETLKTDAALASRILKAANSSAVAAAREVTNLKQAAMLLGKKTISTLALSFSLADQSMKQGGHSELFKAFWNQSLVTGVAASVLSKRNGAPPPDTAFLIGLLSRIGRLGAICVAPDEFMACVEAAGRSGCNVDTTYLSGLDANCEQLTLHYLRSWKLPPVLIEHIAGMQDAGERDRSRTSSTAHKIENGALDSVTSLRVAAALGQFFSGENCGIALATIHELLEPVLVDPEQEVEQLIEEIIAEFDKYSEVLDVSMEDMGTPAELHARAMANLAEIAMAPEPSSQLDSGSAVSEVAWLEDRVKDLAEQLTLDSMTSLRNRAHFYSELDQRIARTEESGEAVAVLFLDINKFKHVNDTYGHDVGDKAICTVAARLKTLGRRDDVVARYGGDEFVILSEMNSTSGLDAYVQRLAKQLEGLSVDSGQGELPISIAIGGSSGTPDGAADFGGRLLRASDMAMYRAKESGRNAVVVGLHEVSQEDTWRTVESGST